MTNNLFSRQHFLGLFLFFLIGFSSILYLKSLSGEFVWDDDSFITHNEWIKNADNAGIFFTPHYWQHSHPGAKGRYRPLRTLSFLADYSLAELNPYGYHLLNLVFHIFNVILVFFVARIIIGNDWGALGAALIFAVHPVNTEAIAWIKNRAELFALFFFLLSFVLFIKSGRYSLGQCPRGILFAGAIISYLFALMSKETALTLPLIITMCGALLFVSPQRKQLLLKTIPLWIITFLFLVFIFWGFHGDELSLNDSPTNPFVHFWAIGKTMSVYITSLFLPLNLHADRALLLPPKLPPADLLIFLATGMIVLFVTVRLRKPYSAAAFSILWIFIALLPSSNLFFLASRPLAEQRLYVPSVGMAILIGSLLCPNGRNSSIRDLSIRPSLIKVTLFSLLIISFSLMTWKRIPVWHDGQRLWEDTIKKNPANHRSHYNLGLIYQDRGDLALARREFSRVVELEPGYFEAHNSMGTIHARQNQFEKAISHYQQALALNPHYARAHYNTGNAFVKTGKYDEAVRAYGEAIRLNPDYVDALANLGWVYQRKELADKALKMLQAALRFDPNHALANFNLGKTYYETGSLPLAEIHIKKALESDPDNAHAHFILGNIYAGRGEFFQSKESYRQALRLNSKFAEAHNNLGNIFQREGKLSMAIQEYEEAIRIQADYPEAYNNLANMFGLQKNFSGAIREYQKAIYLRPDYFEARFGLAGIYFIRGDFERALVEYQKAAELNAQKVKSHLRQALELNLDSTGRTQLEKIISNIQKIP